MSEPSIKAVIWDFGGVLTTSPFSAFNRFERSHGLPIDFIRGINAKNPHTNAWAQFESNQIDIDEFDRLFAAEASAAGHRLCGRTVIELLAGELRPRMVQVLRLCKARYKVACITNNVRAGHGPSMSASPHRAQAVGEVMALFDVVVESSVVGVRKPDPRIYEVTCQRLGILSAEAVFLDDLGINLKPARALGMRTIKVVTEEQAISDLTAVTGLKFDFSSHAET